MGVKEVELYYSEKFNPPEELALLEGPLVPWPRGQ